MKLAVIGAGPAGMMCAGVAANRGYEVTVLDGNEKVGEKLFITGKGRCNVTNNVEPVEFFDNVVNGTKFLYSCINVFPPQRTIQFFESLGLKLKTERGNRVFPVSDKSSDVSDKSSDVISALKKFCDQCRFKLNEKVIKITKVQDKFLITTTFNEYVSDKVLIATGGISYSATGSTGDGYKLAKNFGHTIIPPRSALSPIRLKNNFIRDYEGISLKNVSLHAENEKFKFKISKFGEMIFTEDGISGPIALTMSSYINRYDDVKLRLDFKPALDNKQLDNRLLREFDLAKNKDIKTVMYELLPKRCVKHFLDVCKIDENKKVNSITKEERDLIVHNLKEFPLEYGGLYPSEMSIVTSGGICLNEVNPKTMESKLVSGLYFAGEVLDCDALTGGFNIQIALSTGYVAGNNI